MRVKIIIGLCLISILFLSGCTEFNLNPELERKYFSVIGEGTVEEKEVEIPDVIVIESIKIPALAGGRVKPDRTLDIIVTLRNRDEDKIIPLDYVGISDLGIFTCEDENNCSIIDQTINPGQLKTFSFTIKTPSNEGTIALPGHLEFSAKYRYISTRLATITFIGKDDYMDYLESGGKVSVSIINIPSDGPVELDLDISNIQQPVVINDGVMSSKLQSDYPSDNSDLVNEIADSFFGKVIFADSSSGECPYECLMSPECSASGGYSIEGYYCSVGVCCKPLECNCSDGTSCNQCTPSQPLYCDSTGKFVNKCYTCGCPTNKPLYQPDGSCASSSSGSGGGSGSGLGGGSGSGLGGGSGGGSSGGSSSPSYEDRGEHQIYLEVLNKGSGEIDMIKKGNLKISFEDMNLKVCSKEFGGNSCGGTTTSNNESIVVRGSNPFRYYFSFTPNTDVIGGNSITATKKIEVSAEYTYRLPRTIDILVSPRAEI